ncbi:unnamed protein product [Spirodela intermedia]|uniref:Uncharacterized protein n=1 Tax=Spirodela intermedia TaxID=51605 RepID=A0A7I8IA45_SPIIN|nr:unnamed protein product [Spirodela intermedia]CAA6654460.1 unnamed protein product [Spirodela intermedia]
MSQTSQASDSSSRIVQNDHVESSSVDEESSEVPASGTRPMKKGPWTAAEDAVLKDYVKKHGRGNWNAVQKKTRLARCGKSCRLRWSNHLRANLKKGAFTPEEERTIIRLQSKLGNKWAKISEHLEGRTDNEIKNYWNTRIKRCHRTGAPLYPPDVVPQGTADNPNGGKDDRAQPVRRQSNEDVESTGSDIPPVFFENLRRRSHPFHLQSLFGIPLADLLGKIPGSYGFNIPRPPSDCPRPFPAPETTSIGMPSCSQLLPSPRIDLPMGVNIPYDPEPPDGYFPAFQAPPEAMKPELPSLQYSVLDLGDSLDCSPPPPTLWQRTRALNLLWKPGIRSYGP